MTHSSKLSLYLENESATKDVAEKLATLCQEHEAFNQSLVIYLVGDLGAGKSFFSRAFIQYFLPEARVKSPTYTLVEGYDTENGVIQHFDLYRLADPEELEFLAIRDLLQPPSISLVEWPQKGEGFLPSADIVIRMTQNETGRLMDIEADNLSWVLDINRSDLNNLGLGKLTK